MQPAISKAIAIKNDHPVCATHVQDCHLLARATRDRGCPRYGDRDRVVGFDWLTLNRVQFASKHTRVVLLPGRIFLASRRQRTSTLRTRRSLLELFGQECKNSHNPPTAIGRSQPYRLKYKIARRLKWSEGSRIKYTFWHRAIKGDRGDSGRAPTKNTRSSEEFPPDRHQY